MLSDDDYRALARDWSLSAEGQCYVDRTRQGDPSRLVSSRLVRNTPVRFASRRMGQVIQAESALESMFVRECEYDRTDVLEYYDQPPSVPLVIINRRGRHQSIGYTPDYLVLRRSGPCVIECKSSDAVAELLQKRSHDWVRTEQGVSYVPAFKYFAVMGLVHSIWIPDERSALRASNLDLLLATRHAVLPGNGAALRTRLCTYFAATPIASLRQVVEVLKLPSAMMVLRGIDEGWLYAPLDQFSLSRPDDALISLNAEQFALGSEALRMWRTSYDGTATTQNVPSAARAAEMLNRVRMLQGEVPATKSSRTLRRYRAALKAASGNVRTLIPKARCGNRMPRITEAHTGVLDQSIAQHYANATAVSCKTSHVQYQLDFEEKQDAGVIKQDELALSLRSYRERLRKLNPEELARFRGGPRAANAAAEPVDRDRIVACPQRPFEIAHADHYLGDRSLLLRLSGGRRWSRRPWVSVLRDGTSEVLAMAIGFRTPSRVALSELLRDCVRRHQRLPEMIVSDCGSDFKSVFYETTLAFYGVHKKDRPTAAPRFGGELERLFGTLKTSVLWGRRGSTRNDARGRAVSASHRSNRLAEQDLVDFYHELDEAIFGQLNLHLRGERSNSPDSLAAAGLAIYPMSGIEVAYDFDFMVATSIDAPEKEYRVDRARGINAYGRWYWHPQLARLHERRVEVRIDPWDEHQVYANCYGAWVICRSRGPLRYEGRDLVSMMASTILHLDARTEQAEAQREADLSLARLHRRRDRETVAQPSEPELQPQFPAGSDYIAADLPSFNISWSE